jgi:hypothetical protein
MKNVCSSIIPKNQWKKKCSNLEIFHTKSTYVEQLYDELIICLGLESKDLKNWITCGCDNLRILIPKKDMHHVAHDEL